MSGSNEKFFEAEYEETQLTEQFIEAEHEERPSNVGEGSSLAPKAVSRESSLGGTGGLNDSNANSPVGNVRGLQKLQLQNHNQQQREQYHNQQQQRKEEPTSTGNTPIATKGSRQFDEDNEDNKSVKSERSEKSEKSGFGGSALGTNSTGSGDGEDEDPLLVAIIDIMRKCRAKAAVEAARRAKGGSPGDTPTLGTPQENLLTLPPKETSNVAQDFTLSNNATASPTSAASSGKYHRPTSLLAEAKQSQMQLFCNLDEKSSRALIVADPFRSVIVFANEAAQRLFGRLDLVGATIESLMPPGLAERHPGVVAAYHDRYVAEFKKTGQGCDSRLLDVVKSLRLQVIRKVNSRDVPIYIDGWVRTLRLKDEPLDEPARLMALECVEADQYHVDNEQARIFRSALMNVSDAIVIADFDGRLEWINKSMELLAGYPLAALRATGATVNVFLPANFHAQHEGFLAHFRQNRKSKSEAMVAESNEVVVSRHVVMKSAFGDEDVLLRVEVAYNKLIAFIKSTREFIPRDEFENERLKLLLPASIVKLLRGAAEQDITTHFWEFDNRTVLFTDIVGFSTWAKNRPVKAVHDRMQPMFSEFETIIQAFGGELIHRIGDAVMAIFGFNGEERHHARYAITCACELQQWALQNGFLVRIGLNSGSLGAGIYGSSKGRPGFDAWGPTVNIAKRLEAYGDPGAVHMTQATVKALGHRTAGVIHQIVRSNKMEGVKGVEDNTETFMLPVKAEESNQVVLPEKFVQMINFQRAKYARWKVTNEETERRLAELQKGNR